MCLLLQQRLALTKELRQPGLRRRDPSSSVQPSPGRSTLAFGARCCLSPWRGVRDCQTTCWLRRASLAGTSIPQPPWPPSLRRCHPNGRPGPAAARPHGVNARPLLLRSRPELCGAAAFWAFEELDRVRAGRRPASVGRPGTTRLSMCNQRQLGLAGVEAVSPKRSRPGWGRSCEPEEEPAWLGSKLRARRGAAGGAWG